MCEYTVLFKLTGVHGNADAMSCLSLPHSHRDIPVYIPAILLEQLESSPVTEDQIGAWTARGNEEEEKARVLVKWPIICHDRRVLNTMEVHLPRIWCRRDLVISQDSREPGFTMI